MNLPALVWREFNVRELPKASSGVRTYHVTCPKCAERWSLPIPRLDTDGFNAGILKQLEQHARGHEEVTRRVRLLRGKS